MNVFTEKFINFEVLISERTKKNLMDVKWKTLSAFRCNLNVCAVGKKPLALIKVSSLTKYTLSNLVIFKKTNLAVVANGRVRGPEKVSARATAL